MALSIQKPYLDPEMKAALGNVTFPAVTHLTPEVLTMMRAATASTSNYLDDQRARGISHREVRILSTDGTGHEIILSILEQESAHAK